MQRDKELMQEWVKALRSGEYQQTKKKLHDSDGFCCLGVLCDISVKKDLLTLDGDDLYEYNYIDEQNQIHLLESDLSTYKNKIGLTDEEEITLITMNDGSISGTCDTTEPKSFSEIADYIEQNILNKEPVSNA